MTDLSDIDLEDLSAEDLRKIDAAVEERLFGIEIVWHNRSPYYRSRVRGYVTDSTTKARSFSTDPALIFDIVEVMRGRGWAFHMESGEDEEYFVVFHTADEDYYHSCYDPSLAVSLAALKAKGVIPTELDKKETN